MKNRIKGVVLLFITAFIWGTAFVSQRLGTDIVSPFTFSATRMLLGAFTLLPVIIIKDLVERKRQPLKRTTPEERSAVIKKTITSGLLIGVAFCLAANLQQYAFVYSSAGKIAFITSSYVLIVPFLSLIFGKKISAVTWISVSLGTVGLFLLCVDVKEFDGVNFGDVLAIICAVCFAVHILLIEKLSVGLDGVKISCLQFFVGGVVSLILMFIFEKPSFSAIKNAWLYIAYAGVLSCGVAYTLQIVGQKYVEASFATLIMSMESVFAVIASAIIVPEEPLSIEEIIGCVVMFAAIVLPCVYDIIKNKKEKTAKTVESEESGS